MVRNAYYIQPSIVQCTHLQESELLCPVSSVQCPLSSVLCPVSSVQYPLSSVLCPVSSVICTLYSALCTLYSVLHSVHSTLCPGQVVPITAKFECDGGEEDGGLTCLTGTFLVKGDFTFIVVLRHFSKS